MKSIFNCSLQARIWTVIRVICDILDALLDPDSLLVQLVFPESKVIQLSLEIYQLICYFSGVTAWTYTPETEKQCILLYIKCQQIFLYSQWGNTGSLMQMHFFF